MNLRIIGSAAIVTLAAGCGSSSSRNDAARGSLGDAGSSSGGAASSAGSSSSSSSSGGGSSGSDGASACSGSSGSFPDAGGVVFSVDLGRGPARQFDPPSSPVAISPYVYGVNEGGAWESTTQWGLLRWGGDAFTSWNWTNDFSNSGSDYCFWQGVEGASGLAETVSSASFPSVPTDQTYGFASLVTVPILADVSSSAVTNNVWSGSNPPCPGSPSCSSGQANGYAMNVGNLSFVSTDPGSSAFVANSASKGSPFCTCAGSSCGSCAVDTTGPVFEDEFVNYMKVEYASGSPVFFSLDNEPNYWPSTHPELWPYTGTPGCGTSGTVTFDDVVSRDTTFATAIKAAWPAAEVFGPIVSQDGIVYAGDYSDPNLPGTIFADYYLGKMAAASASAGHPLIDSFDVHYYTSNGSTAQCVQVPRMFWDPNFTTFSASTTDSIDFGWSGVNDYFDTSMYPRQMIPRLLGKIAAAYSGGGTAAPGLSFSEYNPGCETTIEGGVAEADLLGVFGREGVYAAMAWPLDSVTSNGALTNYLIAAYDLYRNYDGAGSVVGDTTVYAQTSDVDDTSVYAFAHSDDATRVDLVAVNKTSDALAVTVEIADAPALSAAAAYDLVDGKAGVVVAAGAAPSLSCSDCSCVVTYTLPAMSATTIVLH